MHLKLKTVAFAILLSFFCPLDADDILDYSVRSGNRKYSKKYQIKDKRCINKSRNNFAKSKEIYDDAELLVEHHQTINSNEFFSYLYFYSVDYIPPVTKYAVWSKATFV